MFLNLDETPHVCGEIVSNKIQVKERNGIKQFFYNYKITPGTEYHDFYEIDLALGSMINGFILKEGSKLLRKNNEIPITITVEREKTTFQKTLTRITLEEFIELYYSKEQLNSYLIKDYRDNSPIPIERVIGLLFKKRGINFVDVEKYLVFKDDE